MKNNFDEHIKEFLRNALIIIIFYYFLYINKIVEIINQSCCATVYAYELNIREILCDKFLLKSILCARRICATLHPMGEFALDNANLQYWRRDNLN